MRIRALDARAIRALAPYEELIPLMRKTLEAVSRGEAELPLRWALQLPGSGGMLVIFKSLGIAAEDIALAAHVHRKSEQLGRGQMVEL